jgi:hypothetical protein
MKKAITADTEKRTELKKGEYLFFRIVGATFKSEPLAANPSNAMLTTMKAKWYQRDTEKILVKEISSSKAPADMKKIPQYLERIPCVCIPPLKKVVKSGSAGYDTDASSMCEPVQDSRKDDKVLFPFTCMKKKYVLSLLLFSLFFVVVSEGLSMKKDQVFDTWAANYLVEKTGSESGVVS